MSIRTGKYAKATFGTTTIANLASIDWALDAPVVTFEAFADTHTKVAGTGMITTAGSLSGALDIDDTDGQMALYNACVSGTNITDFRLYVTDVKYLASNIVEDSAAFCRFTNFAVSEPSPSETITVSADFTFSGKTHLTE